MGKGANLAWGLMLARGYLLESADQRRETKGTKFATRP